MDLSILPNLDVLIAPIPGPNPAGEPVSYVAREKFETARKAINPNDYSPNDPLRPAEPKFADWPFILQLATETLTDSSKDLMTAARLVEAATKLNGFVGLKYGLTFLHRLTEEAWDRIYPVIEDGDVEVRAAAFNWLDDPARGARFPFAVRAVPLVVDATGEMTWLGWKESQIPPPPDKYGNPGTPSTFPERFDKAVAAAPRVQIQTLADEIAASTKAIDDLVEALDRRLGDVSPSLSEVRLAVAEVGTLVAGMLAKKGPAPIEVIAPPPPAEVVNAGTPVQSTNGVAHPTLTMQTREDAYRQLADAATLLQRLEPHSPIPYMIQRAVALGRLPFPELMKVIIRDASIVEQMSRELGLEPAPA
ncbi:type VI secretion system protein TssA [Limnoglobus roseus]|uniref:Type VI secretion system protein TssA n=1 Tax=Limnoglobus roseus TaxID=2598579 RepID=A0A5C1AMV7_9BACT|nr:type VI secretion system protein TssA [Limnoglobus roseus]QEL19453.1 type VI secretion system protein TssA [Limnoglobus roseus]